VHISQGPSECLLPHRVVLLVKLKLHSSLEAYAGYYRVDQAHNLIDQLHPSE
jgi:hypothetical protein